MMGAHQRLKRITGNQRGITLVELLVVIVLVGVVIAIPIQALFLTNRDWQYTQAMSPALMDSNLFFNRLSREIRSADKPESNTRAVEIEDNQLIIYLPSDTAWARIEYRLNEDGGGLQRGTITGTAVEVLDRDSNDIHNWTTIASSVSSVTFTDTDPTSTADRRLIHVIVELSDAMNSQASFQPFTIESTFLSRSQELTIGSSLIIDPDGETIIPVTGVSLDKTNITLRRNHTTTLTATVNPDDATDKSVTWSSSNTGRVSIVETGDNWAIIRAERSNGSAVITVTTTDGEYSAQCNATCRN